MNGPRGSDPDPITSEPLAPGERTKRFRQSVCLSCAHCIVSETPDHVPTVFCLLRHSDLPAGMACCANWLDDSTT